MPDSLPPIVQRFLQRPGAVLYGSYNPEIEDSSKFVSLWKQTPKSHITVQMDNWPEKPRLWFVGSEPCEVSDYKTGAVAGVSDAPYDTEEAA